MKFKHGTRRRAAEYEKDWVQRWKDDQTFEKSVAQRPADNAYVFYDGPPFITGVPHHGTLLSSIVKDAVPRYWTMKGKRVERRWIKTVIRCRLLAWKNISPRRAKAWWRIARRGRV